MLTSTCRPSLLSCCPSNICWLGFQVPLLQVVLSGVFSPHPVRLQAALPGTAVYEHYPEVKTVQVQWVRTERWLFKEDNRYIDGVENRRDGGPLLLLWIIPLNVLSGKWKMIERLFIHYKTDYTTVISEPRALGEMPAVWAVMQRLVLFLHVIHQWTWPKR